MRRWALGTRLNLGYLWKCVLYGSEITYISQCLYVIDSRLKNSINTVWQDVVALCHSQELDEAQWGAMTWVDIQEHPVEQSYKIQTMERNFDTLSMKGCIYLYIYGVPYLSDNKIFMYQVYASFSVILVDWPLTSHHKTVLKPML